MQMVLFGVMNPENYHHSAVPRSSIKLFSFFQLLTVGSLSQLSSGLLTNMGTMFKVIHDFVM